MTMDYYNILKVSRTSGDDELRRMYKRLAMTWHPDRHPSGTKGLAEAKFKLVCEAYDVLSDPSKRHIYDMYGEDGLKYDVCSPSSADDFVDDFLGGFDESKKGNYYGSNRRKAEAIENKLGCSLEELYKGSKRKMAVSRIVPDFYGKPSTVEEVLAIDIKPGWKTGTKITFPEKGNQERGLAPGDLIFVIDEKPHPTFKRDGNDLLITMKISLVEALTGTTLTLTTLDGRNLTVDVSDVVKPGREIVVAGEGMPISKEPRKKGNLRIKFDVVFPARLSAHQKADIKRVLLTRYS
ncbi:hypothetical protein vseg_019965 [Gypsophila vaccaria]